MNLGFNKVGVNQNYNISLIPNGYFDTRVNKIPNKVCKVIIKRIPKPYLSHINYLKRVKEQLEIKHTMTNRLIEDKNLGNNVLIENAIINISNTIELLDSIISIDRLK